MEPRSKEGKAFLRRLVEHFDKSCVRLAMDEPTVFIPLLSSPSLPSPKAMEDALKKDFSSSLAPLSDFVFGLLFALNALPFEEGNLLFRCLFLSKDDREFRDVYSHSGFYRLRAKALRDFFAILPDFLRSLPSDSQ